VANVCRIAEIRSAGMVVDMDLPESIQTVDVRFPCLITVEKGICEPRLPSFLRKVETKDRAVAVMGLKDFGDTDDRHYGLAGSPTRVLRIFPPEADIEQEIWQGPEEEMAHRLFDVMVADKMI
jgi:electron transfer flavoprotein beta subunit